MAELEDWTAADDALVRRAMATLRRDVESAPMPDPRFVRARGSQLRRRRAIVWTAAAAAAAVVVGAVGFAELGRDQAGPVMPATRTTTTPLPTTTTPVASTSRLPLAAEWEQALRMPAGSVTITPVTKGGGVECGPDLGAPTQQDEVHQANSPVSGAAAYWSVPGDVTGALARTSSAVANCQAGPDFVVTKAKDTAFPVYSYATKEAGSGWFVVVPGSSGVALLQLIDPAFNDVASGGFTKDDLVELARIAQVRMNGAPASSAATTTRPSATGATAVDEVMPVSGPDPKPSSKLFVAGSQWTSPGLTAGEKTSAGPGALEGSTAIASCETDQQQAGIGGSVGVVSVRTGTGNASYIGHQRVQLDESTDAVVQKAYVQARLTEAKALYAKGCSFANGTVKSTPGPTDGTYRLDTVFKDGTTPGLSEWVGVTALETPGAVATVVITKASNPNQGFAELDRLLGLARQK